MLANHNSEGLISRSPDHVPGFGPRQLHRERSTVRSHQSPLPRRLPTGSQSTSQLLSIGVSSIDEHMGGSCMRASVHMDGEGPLPDAVINAARLHDLHTEWLAARSHKSPHALPSRGSPRQPRSASRLLSLGVSSVDRRFGMESVEAFFPKDDVSSLIDAATLRGKRTVQRIAREESIRQLKPWPNEGSVAHPNWSSGFVSRFKYRPDTPEFTSRALVSLVEQALLSHQRRVDQALQAAQGAREHATRAENLACERIDEVLMTFKDPDAQHALKQALKAYTLRADKESAKLRVAMIALENETAWAQESHNASMRVVATRLLAQHDASVATVLAELEAAESVIAGLEYDVVGPYRMAADLLAREVEAAEAAGRQLEDELRRVRHENAQLCAKSAFLTVFKFARQAAELQQTRECLSKEQEARKIETNLIRSEVTAEMHSAIGALKERYGGQLQRAHKERSILLSHLAAEEFATAELGTELGHKLGVTTARLEATEAQLQATTRCLSAVQETLRATEADLKEQLSDVREQAGRERRELNQEIQRLHERNRHLSSRCMALHASFHEDPWHRSNS